jgi:hypothetical protein
MILFILACALAEVDTASTENLDGTDTGEGTGHPPVISSLDVLWQEFGNEGVVMYADAEVVDADGDLVGGIAKFDITADGENPIGFEQAIEDCTDVSGACWIDPNLIIAIPDVITSYDYTMALWVIDAAGNASDRASGFLAGG